MDSNLKREGLVEIIEDYYKQYGLEFTLATHAKFKKDVTLRLAHKECYKFIEKEPEKQLDLLIVVDQMLTGFDSKWINTLYLDKLMEYENIIQAFSRTNRLFGPDKPFGTIRYYRKPHTMEQRIAAAVKLYSGDKPIGLFVDRLTKNITKMNNIFLEIKELFENAGIEDFKKLPKDKTEIAKFTSLFNDFNSYLEAAKIQGFKWSKKVYKSLEGISEKIDVVELIISENQYLTLVQRYKELLSDSISSSSGGDAIPYDIKGYIVEIDTQKIDIDYMNSRFTKYIKELQNGSSGAIENALNELHKSFAILSQEDQKICKYILT